MRIIGIDWGTKAMGLSITDPLQFTAKPVVNYFFKESYNFEEALLEIKRVIEENGSDTEKIVVGHPITTSGNNSSQTNSSELFAEQLQEALPEIKVVLIDERNTTKIGMEIMSKEQKKQPELYKDMMASLVLLKDYILK